MATGIMNFKSYNFETRSKGGEIEKGINEGGLWALKKHNEREHLDFTQETKFVKSKFSGNDNIDLKKSQDNIYYKRLKKSDIEELEKKQTRKNGVGAFSIVFDFQDLKKEVKDHFGKMRNDKKSYAEIFKKIIDDFLEKEGISERFEILESVLHLDEENPHFHILFSGWDKKENKWGYNDFISPKTAPRIAKDKKGEVIYQKEPRGKNKGKFKLDKNGNKIPKTIQSRTSRMQEFQDKWGEHLEKRTKSKLSNKKSKKSMLHFSQSVYKEFPKEVKEELKELRKLEKIYYAANEYEKQKMENNFLTRLMKFNRVALKISDKINNSSTKQQKIKI